MKHDPDDGDIIPLHSCTGCAYRKSDPDRCPAFSDGIPEELANGQIEHNRVLPNQVGDLVYEMRNPPVADHPDYGAPPWFSPDFTFD